MSKEEIKVLCIWQPNDRLKQYLDEGLRNYPQVKLIIPPDLESETLLKLAPEADIIMGWRPTKEFLEKAKNARLFINPGAGVQHLIPIFKEVTVDRKLTLVNGHGNAYFTAQHVVAILLALMNKVILHHNWMVEGEWRRGDSYATSIPLRGRKVGLLGYGAVNRLVHKFLTGFDLDFSVLRRDWSKQHDSLPTPVTKYSFDDMQQFLTEVDILIIAVPLTSKTEGLIQEKELELLGKDSLIVNIGRGPIIDEKSLYLALKEEKIKGAAIDVWYNYQPESDVNGKKYPTSYPFHELDNVILSPHRGASPMSDLKRWDEQIENIVRFTDGRRDFINVVNLDEGY
ncbi:MAG: NAD(P)-dependent oxidoreductase [Candidatus Heimdallarchaeaceae archaeon]